MRIRVKPVERDGRDATSPRVEVALGEFRAAYDAGVEYEVTSAEWRDILSRTGHFEAVPRAEGEAEPTDEEIVAARPRPEGAEAPAVVEPNAAPPTFGDPRQHAELTQRKFEIVPVEAPPPAAPEATAAGETTSTSDASTGTPTRASATASTGSQPAATGAQGAQGGAAPAQTTSATPAAPGAAQGAGTAAPAATLGAAPETLTPGATTSTAPISPAAGQTTRSTGEGGGAAGGGLGGNTSRGGNE